MNTTLLLVFARCAGFVFRAPAFAHPSVPPPLRAGMAVALALVVANGLPRVAERDGLVLLVALVSEFLFGMAVGMAASLLYDGAYAGGRALDDYVGLKAVAPNIELVAPSGFGRIWSSVFTGGYVLLGAYRSTLSAFAQSFVRVPPGAPFDVHSWAPYTFTLASTIVLVALGVAAPAIGLAFVVQVTLGALSRTIPRFASFSLSFPMVFGAVLVVTAIAVPLVALQAAHPMLTFPGAHR